MHGSFAFTTSEVAQLAKEQRSSIYTSLHCHGHWRGIRPRKALNGRLIWPREEVYFALGLVPEDTELSPGVRAGVEVLRRAGCQITPETLQVLRALLDTPGNSHSDHGVNEDCRLLMELAHAALARIDAQTLVAHGYASEAARRLSAVRDTLASAVESYGGH